jgi:hypothetical protein
MPVATLCLLAPVIPAAPREPLATVKTCVVLAVPTSAARSVVVTLALFVTLLHQLLLVKLLGAAVAVGSTLPRAPAAALRGPALRLLLRALLLLLLYSLQAPKDAVV